MCLFHFVKYKYICRTWTWNSSGRWGGLCRGTSGALLLSPRQGCTQSRECRRRGRGNSGSRSCPCSPGALLAGWNGWRGLRSPGHSLFRAANSWAPLPTGGKGRKVLRVSRPHPRDGRGAVVAGGSTPRRGGCIATDGGSAMEAGRTGRSGVDCTN